MASAELKLVQQYSGHTLYELNLETAMISKTELFKENGVTKFNIKPNYIYASALNPKNADKKFVKMLTGRG